MKKYWSIIIVLVVLSCNTSTKKESKKPINNKTTKGIPVEPNGGIGNGGISIIDNYLKSIESAHHKNDFLRKKAVSFDVALFFRGKKRLDARITMLTNSSKIRIDNKDHSKLIYDGTDIYFCPKEKEAKSARFDMFTWTYFFGLPYKLNDPGTQWELNTPRILENNEYQTAKLSFKSNTGDSPNDWYIVYSDTESKLLTAAAYIVTYGGTDAAKAEEDPHAIVYKNFEIIENIPLATSWEFYNWTKKDGFKDQIGKATISNIVFLNDESSLFKAPENAKKIK